MHTRAQCFLCTKDLITQFRFLVFQYVHDNEDHVECIFRLVKSQLGGRLERQNELMLRHYSIILLDVANSIHHHTFSEEFWPEELRDSRVVCQDVHTSSHLCKQVTKEPGLVYKTTNYKYDYPVMIVTMVYLYKLKPSRL